MATKKLLSQVLLERSDTVEFRKVKSQLMNIAQNKKREMFALTLEKDTITMLQNQGINVSKCDEFGYTRYKLTW